MTMYKKWKKFESIARSDACIATCLNVYRRLYFRCTRQRWDQTRREQRRLHPPDESSFRLAASSSPAGNILSSIAVP